MRCRIIAAVVVLLFALPLLAADWPHWRGPDRNDVSKETGLLKSWPKAGPKLLWTFDNAGIGFSGPAIVGERLYTLGGRGDDEVLFALDIKTGKEVWSIKVGPLFTNAWGDGPRSTPTVDGDAVYALASRGDLVCVEAATGKKRWQLNLEKDLEGGVPYWGYAESPLVDGDRLICTPGGDKGTFAALDKKTGKVAWRSKDYKDGACYSSIVVAEVGGVRGYVNMTASGVAGVSARDGKLFWSAEVAFNSTAICPSPIFRDNHVYVTSGYSAGCGLIKLSAAKNEISAEKVYANKVMTNHHGGVVLVGDHLYGYCDSKGWVCQEFLSGKQVWADKTLGKGSLTCADGRLYCYSEDDGTCVLVAAAPAGWTESGRFTIPRQTKIDRKSGAIWTHPVVANGRLYLRDNDLLFCFDVSGK